MKLAKHKATLKNGRSAKSPPEQFSRVLVAMQESAAFQSLTASALRLLIRFIAISGAAGTAGRKDKLGRALFTFSNADALRYCALKADAFSRAKDELHAKGFMEWVERGGPVSLTAEGQGKHSVYRLTSSWKEYTPAPKPARDTTAARAAKEMKKMKSAA